MKKTETKNFILSLGVSSLIGTRPEQQDCVYAEVGPMRSVGIVCDGMGGLQEGAAASECAMKQFAQDYENWQDDVEPSVFLCREAVAMDVAVHNLKDKNNQLIKAGTTVAAVIIEENRLYWLGIGDSRIYLIRGNSVVALNRDHNYRLRLDDALQQGLITEEIYWQEEKKADALISYLGKGCISLMDSNEEAFCLQNGDRVLLCTDGLYRTLNEEIILNICYNETGGAQELADMLTKTAVWASLENQDNTSVVMFQYCEQIKE